VLRACDGTIDVVPRSRRQRPSAIGLRRIGKARATALYVGLHVTWASLVTLGTWDTRREPSPNDQAFDPSLRGVGYDIARWPLTIGRAALVAGVVTMLTAWYSAPPWRPGDPPPERPYGLGSPLLVAATFTAGLVIPAALVILYA
jgi:hypothetical protein